MERPVLHWYPKFYQEDIKYPTRIIGGQTVLSENISISSTNSVDSISVIYVLSNPAKFHVKAAFNTASACVKVSALKVNETQFEIQVYDTGSGFSAGEKERVEAMLRNYARTPAKLEGNSIGVLNVQKRMKLLCGRDCGLHYTENEEGGLTAHLLLPIQEEIP